MRPIYRCNRNISTKHATYSIVPFRKKFMYMFPAKDVEVKVRAYYVKLIVILKYKLNVLAVILFEIIIRR